MSCWFATDGVSKWVPAPSNTIGGGFYMQVRRTTYHLGNKARFALIHWLGGWVSTWSKGDDAGELLSLKIVRNLYR